MPEIICELCVKTAPSPTLLQAVFQERKQAPLVSLSPLQMVFEQILGSPSICQLGENTRLTAGIMTARKQLPSHKIIAFTELE